MALYKYVLWLWLLWLYTAVLQIQDWNKYIYVVSVKWQKIFLMLHLKAVDDVHFGVYTNELGHLTDVGGICCLWC